MTNIGEGGVYFEIPGEIRVSWWNMGEGECGDYDPEDPDDTNYLRFDIEFWDNQDQEWFGPQDNSYCTQVPASISNDDLCAISDIMGRDLLAAAHAGGLKREMERWSWVSPDLLKTGRLQ